MSKTTTTKTTLTFAAEARKWAHGCLLHQKAMQGLREAWLKAFPTLLNPSLKELWLWVEELEEQNNPEIFPK